MINFPKKFKIMKSFITVVMVIFGLIIGQAQQNTSDYPSKIPTFELVKIKGDGIFKSTDLKKNKKTLVGIVSPECIHCLLAIEHLNNNSQYLKDINLVFITAYDKDVFMNKFNTIAPALNALKSIEILQDTEYEVADLFKPLSIPTFYLFDKKGNLETVKRGSIEINQIFNNLD